MMQVKISSHMMALALGCSLALPTTHALAQTSSKTVPTPQKGPEATAGLRLLCEGDSLGAKVFINGKRKGECPLDMMVPEGEYVIHAVKSVGDTKEAVFDQTVFAGEGTAKRVEIKLGIPQFTEAGRKIFEEQERQRIAREAELERQRKEAALRLLAQQVTQGAQQTGERSFKDCADCPELVVIPAGSFMMGHSVDIKSIAIDKTAVTPAQWQEMLSSFDEKPEHSVDINSFAIGKTAVTQQQWLAVMGSNPSRFKECGPNCPVEKVSWNDAQQFIQKLNAKTGMNYRLPSEAEWEYACRAGGKHQYCGSDNVDAVGWYESNSGNSTHPVAGKQVNAFGLYDMSGNVGQWVQDWYHPSYDGAPTDGSVWLSGGNQNERVLRGGNWSESPRGVLAAFRRSFTPDYVSGTIGFRLARTLVTP